MADRRAADRSAWQRDVSLIDPCRKLLGLKDFYVHLSHPKYQHHERSQEMKRLQKRKTLEKRLERQIMGDEYDAESRGKFLHPHRYFVSSFDE